MNTVSTLKRNNRAGRRARGSYVGFLRSFPKAAPFNWSRFRASAPWFVRGGYSPSGNSWVCPFHGCGFGIAGLDSEPDEFDDVLDPVVDHLQTEHDGQAVTVDWAGKAVA